MVFKHSEINYTYANVFNYDFGFFYSELLRFLIYHLRELFNILI